jgi:hypothetical protein
MPATAKMKPMKINSFTLPFLRLLATRCALLYIDKLPFKYEINDETK